MLKDKIAVVTGASRGIGKSISLALAAQGAKIVAVDITTNGMDELLAEIKALGSEGIAVAGNVTVSADTEQMIDAAVAGGRPGGDTGGKTRH
jgi:3-oxoacyl-[acyl-carrier protein] reductase